MNQMRFEGPIVRVVAAITILIAHTTVAFGDSAQQERACVALGLTSAEVVSLIVDRTPGKSQEITIPVDGETLTLALSKYSVRTEGDYRVIHQIADGSYVTVAPRPVRTVRGSIRGVAGSIVAGSVLEDGLTAVVEFPDGRRYWVEPIASLVEGSAAGDHIVYRDEDVISGGGSCATQARALDFGNEPPQEGTGCTVFPCVAELACDADFEYFSRWGGATEDRIHQVINIVNVQYERDVDITHQIPVVIIRTSPGAPYTGNNTTTLLAQLRAQWNANHGNIIRDAVQLFTGKNLSGSPIGEAFGIGVICFTSFSYSVVQSDFNNNLASATDLSAHELGHLWSAIHCNCLTWTMHAVLQSANRFIASSSIPHIVSHRNSRTCLDDTVIPMTVFPLEDNFNAPEFDVSRWAVAGAEINDVGDGEPSPPTSVNFNNADTLTTLGMDASEGCDVSAEYWWQRTGNAGSPEPGEDLVVEFRTANGFWLEVARHPGEGADNLPYQFNSIPLPGNALHSTLQVRWSMIDGESSDAFFIDNVRIGCPDTDPPEIVHATGLPGETRPFSGYVDPRIESTNGADLDQGLTEIALLFSRPVQHVAGGPLGVDSFVVTETGGGVPPTVVSVASDAMPLVTLTLDRPITLLEYTTVRAVVKDLSDPPRMIANNGNAGPGVDEPDRVDIAFLPADVDQSEDVTPFDLLVFRQIVNDVVDPTPGIDEDFVDINRSGAVEPFDLLVFRQMVNGISPATRAWAGASLNNERP